jgi:GTP-binding protein HflX
VAAFRATLEEVLDSDLILHVRDISHPETENQARDVMAILADLGVRDNAPMIEVWNKIDLLDDSARHGAIETASRSDKMHVVSALTGQGLENLLSAISKALTPDLHFETLNVPYGNGKGRAWLFEEGVIEEESADETGYIFQVKWTARQAKKFRTL